MFRQGKFETFREIFTGLLFTAVVVVVVGGTTAMLLEPAPLLA